jgi:hypothetical protein
MALFTTRVELHDAPSGTYTSLHEEMAKDGFKRTISWESDPAIYVLPTAEYNLSADLTTQQVLDKAKVAARRAWRNSFGVVVTKADGPRKQFGLKAK